MRIKRAHCHSQASARHLGHARVPTSPSDDEAGCYTARDERDQRIQDAPGPGIGEERTEQPGAVVEAEKEQEGRRDRAEREGRPPAVLLRRHRPQKGDRIEIDVRIEPGPQASGEPSPRSFRLAFHPILLLFHAIQPADDSSRPEADLGGS